MSKRRVSFALESVGLVAVAAGMYLIWPPLGIIFAGLAAIFISIWLTIGRAS